MNHEVATGVHRFSDAMANWYAAELESGLVLIDCGWPRSYDAVITGLRAIGRDPRELRALLLTHGHVDHVGSARQLAESDGVELFAHENELERVRGNPPSKRSQKPLARELWRPHAVRFVVGALRSGELSVRWPPNGRSLAAADADGLLSGVRVIETPGHSEGHVAYHLVDRGIVFSGDALVTLDVLTGHTGPRLHPAAFQPDIARARDSLAALAIPDADLLLPGHGDPWRGPLDSAVEDALARR